MDIDKIKSFFGEPGSKVRESKLEYVPLLGALVSLHSFGRELSKSDQTKGLGSHKVEYLEPKSFSRFAVLAIPFLGNLIIGIYDFQKFSKVDKCASKETPENYNKFESTFIASQKKWIFGTTSDGDRVRFLDKNVFVEVTGAEGSYKQLWKTTKEQSAYTRNQELKLLLADARYKSSTNAKVLQKNKKDIGKIADLNEKFLNGKWDFEGVEIPFASDGKSRQFANLGTPYSNWREEKPRLRKDLLQVLNPVVNGLKRLHENNIVHRDIKPDNMVVSSQGEGKLIDWDMWCSTTSKESIPKAGTLDYKGLELLTKSHLSSNDLKPLDVFALGVSLYEIFQSKSLQKRIGSSNETEICRIGALTDPIAQLIYDMTRPEPSERPTMEQVSERFQAMRS